MRLAVSNIAWPPEADAAAARLLADHGVAGVEIAPARVCERPWAAPPERVVAYRRFWEERGLPIVAMQALLFGRPELVLFADAAARHSLRDHLLAIIDLASGLGAERLVFGSPKNRLRAGLGRMQAEAIAIPFFRDLGRRAADRGVWLCIEPNPVEYGCDFLVDSRETIRFVERVGEAGLGVHLDAGGMRLAGESPVDVVGRAGHRWRHFHASEPHLAAVGEGGVDHVAMAAALREVGYDGFVSVEMVQGPAGTSWHDRLARSLMIVRAAYGDDPAARTAA
ncbi:MAG: sugar phosphate isomerase/epimerase family protein [Pirellulales bacterium]